jgi:hypothetical protein
VIAGAVNKKIAFELGISEITVKLHRSNMMRKMGSSSITQLYSVWQSLPADIRALPIEDVAAVARRIAAPSVVRLPSPT